MASSTGFFGDQGSTAVAQRSLADASARFPLHPPLLTGCPATSGPDRQYPLEIDYDYDRISPHLFAQPALAGLNRWAPILPPLLPELSLGEGGTALVPSSRLADRLGLSQPIWLKDESGNPTWSHKDRLNYCLASTAVLARYKGIAVASTGNHGASAAAYANRAGLGCVVISSPGAQSAFERLQASMETEFVLVPREQRWPVLRRIVEETGFMPVSNLTHFHTGNPFGPEGYKTIAYEICTQMNGAMPGTVIVPTGYGEMLFGIAKGFAELVRFGLIDYIPKIISAEPAALGPLAAAMSTGTDMAEVPMGRSVAAGITCTVSSYRGRLALERSGGKAATFSESSIAKARALLEQEGFWQEYSGAAAIAVLVEMAERGEAIDGPVVAILTSTGLKDDGPAHEAQRTDLASIDSVITRLISRYGRP